MTYDPIRLEVFKNLLSGIAEEMGVTLCRTAFSPNIKERKDFSCALFDGEGRMIAQAEHIPVHLGAMPMSVLHAIEHVDMAPGDGVLVNDPYGGGTHLPDITLVTPIFVGNDRRPSFFAANRAHHLVGRGRSENENGAGWRLGGCKGHFRRRYARRSLAPCAKSSTLALRMRLVAKSGTLRRYGV